MSKMAPLVGRDIAERYFLPRFEVLCSDPLFHVRKVRAARENYMDAHMSSYVRLEVI